MAISVAAHSAQQSGARVQPGVPGLQPGAASPSACGKQAAVSEVSNSYGFPQLPMPPTFPMGPMFGFPFLPGALVCCNNHLISYDLAPVHDLRAADAVRPCSSRRLFRCPIQGASTAQLDLLSSKALGYVHQAPAGPRRTRAWALLLHSNGTCPA